MKVLQFMRGMGYQPTAWDRNIYPKLSSMAARVGQMVHESPDQFSFFLPDYSPPGQMAQASLFAPPAQVLTLSTTISSLEGFFSLVRQGLTSSSGGFGSSILGSGSSLSTGDYSSEYFLSVIVLSGLSHLINSTQTQLDILVLAPVEQRLQSRYRKLLTF